MIQRDYIRERLKELRENGKGDGRWLLSAEVRQKLHELDQAELEVSLTEDLLFLVVLSSRLSVLDKLWEVRQVVF